MNGKLILANNHELMVAHESTQQDSLQDIIQNLKVTLSPLGCENMHDPTHNG